MLRDNFSRRRFISIAASALGVAALGGLERARADETVRWHGSAMGAQVSIDIHHPDHAEAHDLVKAAVSEVRRLERLFSLYQPASAICELNRSGVLVAPEPDMVALFNVALEFSELTQGAFDPTVQPLWQLYQAHFGKIDADPTGPTADEIAGALSKVGFGGLKVSADRIALLKTGAAITLNGIAQGYATDRVVDLLRRAGLDNALVDIGEIRALGAHPDGSPWLVGLSDPDTAAATLGAVNLIDRAIATSAATGFSFDPEGRFNHLFDPTTGRSPSLYRSISVVAPTATEADAFSTAFSVMHPQAIARIAKQRQGMEVYSVCTRGKLRKLI